MITARRSEPGDNTQIKDFRFQLCLPCWIRALLDIGMTRSLTLVHPLCPQDVRMRHQPRPGLTAPHKRHLPRSVGSVRP
ncbi:hypothetical protein ElyMa_006893800 [Elysia marginata]|uniref:Uncharacterized protein n=1 Tax=Elysia marginata TaxID=1093978 RepID=A0AAV4JE96_9GAST|nr:hypothetical protein ElyMa_006893800 [Elysia marginata]